MDKWVTVLVIIMLPQIASASSIFDILNEPYIDSINELPYSIGNPSVNWQQSTNIKGWIDIVGWNNLSKDNTTYFIQGSPDTQAIVQYNAYGTQRGFFDSIDNKISYSQSNNQLTAILHVTLNWHTISCDENSCWIVRHQDSADFSDSEVIPMQAEFIPEIPVEITEYYHPIEPKVALWANQQNLSKITVSYNGNSITHKSAIYHVEQTEKGIYYANKTKIDSWGAKGQGVTRFGNSVIINENPINISYGDVNVTISNLYDSQRANISSFNISKVTFEPEKTVYNPLLFGFLGIFGIFMGSSYYLIRQVIN